MKCRLSVRRMPVNVVRISDGLGNQMFQYAFARKLQEQSGTRVYLDTRYINHEDLRDKKDHYHKKCGFREYGLQHLRITLPVADEKILRRWNFCERESIPEKMKYRLSQAYLWPWQYRDEEDKRRMSFSVNNLYSTYYKGYYFHLKYFDDIKAILQKEFRVKKPFTLPADLREVLEAENTVGLHVRRGDFVKLSCDISYTDYYRKAVERIAEYVENPVYLIFSDDIKWVRENMELAGRKIYVSEMGFTDYEELTIMKHCRHNIIANSTFSYWAAYLNDNPDKIVICPKRWKTDIISKEWIGI